MRHDVGDEALLALIVLVHPDGRFFDVRMGQHMSLDLIAEGFNLFNRFNEASANPFYSVVNAFNERSGGGKYYSQPTSAFDPRQFQFGAKFNF